MSFAKFMPDGQISRNDLPVCNNLILPAWEIMALKFSLVYYSLGVPRGYREPVVVVPGLLGSDLYLTELFWWLFRMGYHPYYSGIVVNDCPDILMRRLDETINLAHKETGQKIHMVGHSFGGILSRLEGVRNSGLIASVTTLGSPFRGKSIHPVVSSAADLIKKLARTRNKELPSDCGTGRCTCGTGLLLRESWPKGVFQTCIFSRIDGMVDPDYCQYGRPDVDFEVSASHLGMAFNPFVYEIIARRLAEVSKFS